MGGRRKKRKKKKQKKNPNPQKKEKKKPKNQKPPPVDFSLFKKIQKKWKKYINEEKKKKKKKKKQIKKLKTKKNEKKKRKVNDRDFHHDSGRIKGNAPEKPELRTPFVQSGFYDFVRSSGFKRHGTGNMLHRERHYKVVSRVAMEAALNGIRHTFGNETPYEPLYDILIECMSNTNNHAMPNDSGKCNWWLYVYNDPHSRITSYSFLDLGVGIFESSIVQNYVKKFLKGTFLYPHIRLVDELLDGKIQSRIEEDNEIRGKGIPQIVGHSKLDSFREFYLITNDVKVNIKTGQKEQLGYNLGGTFWYWELQPMNLLGEDNGS